MAFIADVLVEIIRAGVVVKSGYTDANGKYSTVVGAGTYTIRLSKAGYQTIEKTETLAYSSELMINLPDAYPPPYVSGIGAISTLGAFPNPTLSESVAVDKDKIAAATATLSESVAVDKDKIAAATATITESVEVTVT